MIDPDRLRSALADTRRCVDEAAVRSGRSPADVEIVVAGKYVAAEDAPSLVAAGAPIIGENRLQDLEAKRQVVGDALTFDFIGHLQRRKVPAVLGATRLIHSVDSERLAREIAARAIAPIRVLIEVNISDEPTKHGILTGQIEAFVETVTAFPAIVIGGLMALPPAESNPEHSRPYFQQLRRLRDELAQRWHGRHDFGELSMGTSQDFVVAVEEGATLVRIGRSLIDRSQVT
jgi:pyridoxal phosphate enzyme (YggS family)